MGKEKGKTLAEMKTLGRNRRTEVSFLQIRHIPSDSSVLPTVINPKTNKKRWIFCFL